MPEAVVRCPVCNGQTFIPIESFANDRITTTYTACDRCGLVAMNPRPTVDELNTYYAAEYWQARTGDESSKRAKQARRAKFILAFLERHLGTDTGEPLACRTRVLEVGSSFGATLLAVQNRVVALGGNATLFAVEPSDYALAKSPEAYRLIRVIGRSWEDLRRSAYGPYDLIILSHVLEHFSDPVEAARVIGGALAPGGALFVEVPNLYGHPSVEYAHNFCFTKASLWNTLGRAGLHVTALEVNGHDEDFPFYLTCLAICKNGEVTRQPELIADIRARRAAATEAFKELRRKRLRPE